MAVPSCPRDFCAVFIKAAGVWTPPPWLYLPRWLAFVIAYLAVAMAWLLRPIVSLNPTVRPGLHQRHALFSSSSQPRQ
jgi:hypothetical protein